MKKSSVLFLLAMLLISISIVNTKCKSKSNEKKILATDTLSIPKGYDTTAPKKRTLTQTRVIAVFVTAEKDNIVHDMVWKLKFDSVQTLIEAGKGVFKQVWGVDSVYYFPKQIILLDTITKKPLRDSNGNPKFITDYFGPHSKELVWDSNIGVDSAHNRFKVFLLPDSLKKK